MNILTLEDKEIVINFLNSGLVGVMPTDTIYGISAKALSEKSVERLYSIKGRKKEKPCIVLISSVLMLNLFDIKIEQFTNFEFPEKTTLVLPTNKHPYLDRGKGSIAFRLINQGFVHDILKRTGPLVSSSANKESFPYAKNIKEAIKYFENEIDFYVDGGHIENKPSKIIDLTGSIPKIIRD